MILDDEEKNGLMVILERDHKERNGCLATECKEKGCLYKKVIKELELEL